MRWAEVGEGQLLDEATDEALASGGPAADGGAAFRVLLGHLGAEHARVVRRLCGENAALRSALEAQHLDAPASSPPLLPELSCALRAAAGAAGASAPPPDAQLRPPAPPRRLVEEAAHCAATPTHGGDAAADGASSGGARAGSVLASRPPDVRRPTPPRLLLADAAEAAACARAAAVLAATRPEPRSRGRCSRLVRHAAFEKLTFVVLAANAVWFAVDADFNTSALVATSARHFQICEVVFGAYFVAELLLRFLAFDRRRAALADARFVFDTGLVALMVVDVVVLTVVAVVAGESEGLLRTARATRLLRLLRLLRLHRAFPRWTRLLTGLVAAAGRAVVFAVSLLFLLLYIFGIMFTQLAGEQMPDKFGQVPASMHMLFLEGVLLDGVGAVAADLAAVSPALAALFYLFVVSAVLLVANLLIAVLSHAVGVVAAAERERAASMLALDRLREAWREQRREGTGDDGSDLRAVVFEDGAAKFLESPAMQQALIDLGVDHESLKDANEEPHELGDLAFLALRRRRSNPATLGDVVALRRDLGRCHCQGAGAAATAAPGAAPASCRSEARAAEGPAPDPPDEATPLRASTQDPIGFKLLVEDASAAPTPTPLQICTDPPAARPALDKTASSDDVAPMERRWVKPESPLWSSMDSREAMSANLSDLRSFSGLSDAPSSRCAESIGRFEAEFAVAAAAQSPAAEPPEAASLPTAPRRPPPLRRSSTGQWRREGSMRDARSVPDRSQSQWASGTSEFMEQPGLRRSIRAPSSILYEQTGLTDAFVAKKKAAKMQKTKRPTKPSHLGARFATETGVGLE